MRKELALLGSFWFGAAMGAAALVLFALTGDLSSVALAAEAPMNLIYHYQTLITGILAVVAAFFAVRETRRQIAQQYELEKKRRQRHNAAARTALPMALDELCGYAHACSQLLAKVRDYKTKAQRIYDEQRFRTVTVPADMLSDLPKFPSAVIPILSNCVESADDNAANAISALSSALQIQGTHMRSMIFEGKRHSDPGTVELFKANLDVYILDAIDIYARASNLFEFARGDFKEENYAPTREDIKSALNICSIYKEHYPDVWARKDKKYKPRSQDA